MLEEFSLNSSEAGFFAEPFYFTFKKTLIGGQWKSGDMLLAPQNIMKDKWMNMGYEDDELKPFIEPEPDFKDIKRIGTPSSATSACEKIRVTAIASEEARGNLQIFYFLPFHIYIYIYN